MLFMCSHYQQAPRRNPARQGIEAGFALVLSLVLMAFILLLMVSLSIFITVEVQASRTSNLQQQARQNATLALNTALAELQRVAGPDQRVTARADILESRSDIDDSDSTVANRYYTAVWDVSWESGTKPADWPIAPGTLPHHNRNLKPYFLVSGNEGYEFSTSNAPFNEGTTNFSNPIAFPEIDVTVEGVGIRDTDGQRVGNYAWWIGDEGVKAKITQRNPQEVLARPNPALFSPGGNPALLHSSLSGFDFMSAAEDLANVYQLGDLHNVDSGFDNLFDPDDPKRFESFHDIGLYSMGVLADVRNGGLKKDLSPTFGMGVTIPSEVADAKTLFPLDPDGTANSNFIIFNPSFGQLRSYYRAENLLTSPPSGLTVIPGINTWENSPIATYRTGTNTVSGVAPVVIRAQNKVTPFVIRDFTQLSTSGQPLLCLYYAFQPLIVLWNPYDTAITSPRMLALDWGVTGGKFGDHSLEGTHHRFRIYNKLSLPAGAEGRYGETTFYDLRLPQFGFELPEVVIPAGRAVIFSPPPFDAGNVNYHIKNNRISLVPGYNFDGYFVHVATHMKGLPLNSDEVVNVVQDTGDPVEFWWDELGALDYEWGAHTSSNTMTSFFNQSWNLWDFIELDGAGNPTKPLTDPLAKIMQLTDVIGSQGLGSSPHALSSSDIDFFDDLAQFESIGIDVDRFRYLRIVAMKFPGMTNVGLGPNVDKIKWLRDFNPRAEWSSAFLYSSSFNLRLPGVYDRAYVRPPNSFENAYEIIFADDDIDLIFVSPWSAGTAIGPGRAIIHSIHKKDRPLWNMAELTHANLLAGERRSNTGTSGGSTANHATSPRGSNNRAPAFPLGNSYVPILVGYDRTMTDLQDYDVSGYVMQAYFHDHSYLINEGLYDRYFLSGASTGSATQLNPKLVFAGEDPAVVNKDDSISFDDTAASFLMDGTFNVNSTSQEAWKTFLGGVRDTPLALLDEDVDGGVGSGTPTVQLPSPAGVGLNESSLTSALIPSISDGYRRMSDTELGLLAEQIVRQVKLRGPFPSMSAFVNRVLADPSSWNPSPLYRSDFIAADQLELVESGALQAALDASVNEKLISRSELDATYHNDDDSIAASSLGGSIAEGLSAFVMQSDLLGQMDSMMNVRSDTFTIMAYGDVLDPLTGNVVATARCEAVVQRIPDYLAHRPLDDEDNESDGDFANADPYSSTAEPALSNALNQKMGRRFVVVAFRWL